MIVAPFATFTPVVALLVEFPLALTSSPTGTLKSGFIEANSVVLRCAFTVFPESTFIFVFCNCILLAL